MNTHPREIIDMEIFSFPLTDFWKLLLKKKYAPIGSIFFKISRKFWKLKY